MKNTKHTSGPWTHERDGLIIAADGTAPAMANVYPKKEETLANAKLIAAAPELLDIVEWMIKRLKEPKIAALWESLEEHAQEIEIYENVIRKAKGEL